MRSGEEVRTVLYTEALKQEVSAAIIGGMSYQQACEKYAKRAPSTVYGWVKRYRGVTGGKKMKSKKIRFKESEVLSKLDKEKRELELALSRMSLKVHCLKIASKICTEEGVAFKYMIASEFFVLAAATPALLNQGVFSGDNLIGDVCGDQAVALVGGLGVAPTRSINTTGRTNKVFAEPLHGTAPDIAGKNIADPVAMIQTSGMILSHFGYPKKLGC